MKFVIVLAALVAATYAAPIGGFSLPSFPSFNLNLFGWGSKPVAAAVPVAVGSSGLEYLVDNVGEIRYRLNYASKNPPITPIVKSDPWKDFTAWIGPEFMKFFFGFLQKNVLTPVFDKLLNSGQPVVVATAGKVVAGSLRGDYVNTLKEVSYLRIGLGPH